MITDPSGQTRDILLPTLQGGVRYNAIIHTTAAVGWWWILPPDGGNGGKTLLSVNSIQDHRHQNWLWVMELSSRYLTPYIPLKWGLNLFWVHFEYCRIRFYSSCLTVAIITFISFWTLILIFLQIDPNISADYMAQAAIKRIAYLTSESTGSECRWKLPPN